MHRCGLLSSERTGGGESFATLGGNCTKLFSLAKTHWYWDAAICLFFFFHRVICKSFQLYLLSHASRLLLCLAKRHTTAQVGYLARERGRNGSLRLLLFYNHPNPVHESRSIAVSLHKSASQRRKSMGVRRCLCFSNLCYSRTESRT